MHPRPLWLTLWLISTAALLVPVGSATAFAERPLAAPSALPAIAPFMAAAPLPPAPPPVTAAADAKDIPAPPWGRDLNLSAEQRSRLKTINEQARQQGEKLHEKLMDAEMQLRSQLRSDASIQQLRQLYQDVQKLRQQLDENHFEAFLGERQVLTATQLKQLIERARQAPSMPPTPPHP